ncbi:variable surface lipoprotein [Metamycoplasma hominis]|uniref:variable surface lipoprotein n=1 Tax=Metamycoplasma hominis TaxID=2098 RepID=UPI00193A798F|nr:variable surface lipoprotein [Metamycoplasma hominis]
MKKSKKILLTMGVALPLLASTPLVAAGCVETKKPEVKPEDPKNPEGEKPGTTPEKNPEGEKPGTTPEVKPEEKSELQKATEGIADATVKANFESELKKYREELKTKSEEILKPIIENKEIIAAVSEKELPNITKTYNEAISKLNEILDDIILSTLKEYNTNKTKVSDGLMTIKNYLTKEKISNLIKKENGLADFLVAFGKNISKYAKAIFETLKTNESTKAIAQLNDLITAVDNKFAGKDNLFETTAKKLKEFDFSKLTEEGYLKTFEKLIKLLSDAKAEAVAVLKSVKMSEEDIKKVKDVIRPIYNVLNEGLKNSINLFEQSLRDLPKVLEILK